MDTEKKDFAEVRHLWLMVKSIDQANPNIVHARVSTDEIDRYGEIVQPSSIKEALGPFLANPVVLPAHAHRLENGEPPVIGNIVTESIRIDEHWIDMDVEFDDDELGRKYARKYQKKMMRAFSIGFRGLEGEHKDLDRKRVWIWTKIELLEVSAVAVPANRGALARALSYYDAREKNTMLEALLNSFHDDINELGLLFNQLKDAMGKDFDEVREDLEEIKTLLIPDSDGLAKGLLLGGPIDPPAPAGADKTAEHCERIRKAFNKGD